MGRSRKPLMSQGIHGFESHPCRLYQPVREQTAALRAERSQLVRRLREQGWTLGRLAGEFGVTRTRIQQYEAGDGDG
jgi:hypothetical protein